MDTTPDSKQPQSNRFKAIFSKIHEWLIKYRPQFIYIRDFLFVVIVYGALLSYVLTVLFQYRFSLKIALALGIAFYFIKEELPRVINKSVPKTRT